MPFITREDGVHFVIPSYRDVLSAKNNVALKKEILLLSQSYGEYITMQPKGSLRFEVAFSTDTGYLLGESIWHRFNRPPDMIFCEAIPGTTEAILVIVKSGSVYLDGRFPLDSIPEELVIFLTQENNFDIYVYGDVPITEHPEEGKFAFDAASVHSFTILKEPVFENLVLLRQYQLQPVAQVLKSQGIGVFPLKQAILVIAVIGLGWMLWSFIIAKPTEVVVEEAQINPYQAFIDTLRVPAPDVEIKELMEALTKLYTMPGWTIKQVEYTRGSVSVNVLTDGSKIEALTKWAELNGASMTIHQNGVYISMSIPLTNRPFPANIYPLSDVLATLIDRISTVYPGNRIQLAEFTSKGVYRDVSLTMTVEKVTPLVLVLIGEQFKDLPLVLNNVSLAGENGMYSGTISFAALGS